MKCEKCNFCKYDNSIKEFVCSIEPDLPVVFKDVENNCEKASPIVKNKLQRKANPLKDTPSMPQWKDDEGLMDWLRNLI